MPYDVVAQIASLDTMDGKELRGLWGKLFQRETSINHRPYLIARLAHRIQELAYGGLDEDTNDTLNTLVDGEVDFEKQHKRLCKPPVGTKIVREYHGVEHHVTVIRTGFEYKGQNYKSLSEIARVITGTRWSGPVFFGLKDPSKKPKK